ncbi:hypothetical protein CC85DRAFT_326882 [Cutaneotrichosporon oleaginosum]|uniref:Uncharacterized protein n=1 Tax=Cutaneotrichosporon oleaginosum TaxID=879819 RepID=A0A0J0XSC1_9TREE|nr:uncharacterized protein CC85DRAFT_326882 [Cutaneotrichosporon oleaginosum]KLT43983.1 hypothetical protein CC85DRAFT_326882 [Cutaneotrichosporon oleaginosum]TXT04070.1 hypothetical protein COLE_07767 [Cutaneotrichosporon oleaginosum]
MPPKAANYLTPEHDAIILRAVTASVLASRRTIYTTPGLEAVANNGGSRINQRVQQMLKKMCAAYGLAGVVEEEVAAASGKKEGAGRQSNGKGTGKGKKRKIKDEVKDELEDEAGY